MTYKPRRLVPPVLRIWPKVRQNEAGCWVWTGRLYPNGYGAMSVGRRGENVGTTTHRLMYREVFGPVPEGLQLDHLCRNRACCNPWHLEPVTARVNLLRGTGWSARNAAKTHCVHGHEFNDRNTYRFTMSNGNIGRTCRVCHRLREADRRSRLLVAS